ncbi:MAG: hypothetical protein WCL23_02465 [Candidatus Moraniibacteriota bacterium]
MNEFEKQFQSAQSEDTETKKRKEIDQIKERIFDRETPEAYIELAKKVGIIELKAPYAENLLRTFYQGYHDYPGSDPSQELSELGKLISEEAKDGTVLDLGCGKSRWMASFFGKNNAGLYIGVDLLPDVLAQEVFVTPESDSDEPPFYLSSRAASSANDDMLDGMVNESAEEEAYDEKATIELIELHYNLQDNTFEIQDDMLCAISRMKDESVDMVIVSGIEKSFKNSEETKEYFHALDVEIRRVLKKSGIVMDYESDVSISDMEQVMGSGDRHVNWEVLRKADSEIS